MALPSSCTAKVTQRSWPKLGRGDVVCLAARVTKVHSFTWNCHWLIHALNSEYITVVRDYMDYNAGYPLRCLPLRELWQVLPWVTCNENGLYYSRCFGNSCVILKAKCVAWCLGLMSKASTPDPRS
jgi:hypothetical protein